MSELGTLPARCAHETLVIVSDQPTNDDFATPFTTKLLFPFPARRRFSTIVSTRSPSVSLMPAPRQISSSSNMNQDLRAVSELFHVRRIIPETPTSSLPLTSP